MEHLGLNEIRERYLSFFHLSPSENFSLLIKEIPRRTTKLIKRIVKGKP